MKNVIVKFATYRNINPSFGMSTKILKLFFGQSVVAVMTTKVVTRMEVITVKCLFCHYARLRGMPMTLGCVPSTKLVIIAATASIASLISLSYLCRL